MKIRVRNKNGMDWITIGIFDTETLELEGVQTTNDELGWSSYAEVIGDSDE